MSRPVPLGVTPGAPRIPGTYDLPGGPELLTRAGWDAMWRASEQAAADGQRWAETERARRDVVVARMPDWRRVEMDRVVAAMRADARRYAEHDAAVLAGLTLTPSP